MGNGTPVASRDMPGADQGVRRAARRSAGRSQWNHHAAALIALGSRVGEFLAQRRGKWFCDLCLAVAPQVYGSGMQCSMSPMTWRSVGPIAGPGALVAIGGRQTIVTTANYEAKAHLRQPDDPARPAGAAREGGPFRCTITMDAARRCLPGIWLSEVNGRHRSQPFGKTDGGLMMGQGRSRR